MKKNDKILVGIVLIASMLIFLFYNLIYDKNVDTIVIKVDGQVEGVYKLSENQEISINNGTNILIIKDGEADMIEAECPDKLCVKQKAISKGNENIICLPNKIVVSVESDDNAELDAVTN